MEATVPVTEPHVAAKDFLRLQGLTPSALDDLLDLASSMRDQEPPAYRSVRGRSVACLFERPSTWTRVSFETAAHRLGLLRAEELQLGHGEPIEDTASLS